jgi:hypothetical protein
MNWDTGAAAGRRTRILARLTLATATLLAALVSKKPQPNSHPQ